MKNIIYSLLFFSVFISCVPSKRIGEQNTVITNNLNLIYQKEAIKGFSVAVVNDKGLLYSHGFGFRDHAEKQVYTSNTTQKIASISKTLIGVALLKAQELGKLNLKDPINQYLPFSIINPNHPTTPIIIEHLAYHTSSINDLDEIYAKSYVLNKEKQDENDGVYSYFNKAETFISLRQFMQNTLTENGIWYDKNIFLNSKPGEQREYSNIAAALCALVIESATGQDYRSFTQEHILKPLKMVSSGWTAKDTASSQHSRLFAYKDKPIAEYSLITYADGGFITSSHDLGLFLSELINGYNGKGKLLNHESYRKLFEKQTFNIGEKIEQYGVFFEFRDNFLTIDNEMIGHNGSDPGVFTAMYFNPKTQHGKIVLVNTDTDFKEEVWPEIENIWKTLSDYEKKINH